MKREKKFGSLEKEGNGLGGFDFDFDADWGTRIRRWELDFWVPIALEFDIYQCVPPAFNDVVKAQLKAWKQLL